ncbi:uncharacterized protein LOC110463936 [Mizuhopecten yessoensis]|uniref:uncharacterized protein LOC110463936 n=1 Tax=Mizuhopecten yessoensis TaxID=6573 RepID=UPI000B45E592|nr:uncharacterized protein LOC110463936 [Mizuhopecten yessoensis]XP_021374570.1 uncharacterized protein LOC110463936 [Mizuhopecten yessoensis]
MKDSVTLLVFSTVLLVLSLNIHPSNAVCQIQCGWKAECKNLTCECPAGYELHPNQQDCKTAVCIGRDCLECDSENKCQRCTNFLSEQSRECLPKCNGEAKIIQSGDLQGSVCTELKSDDSNLDIIIGIAAGVSAAIIICLIMGIIVYCHLRKNRQKINLQQQKNKAENMQLGKLTAIPTYDNKGYEPDVDTLRARLSGVVDRDQYQAEYEKLLPQAEVLLMLLNQIRRKLRAMNSGDPRVPTYKGVIHQLCRVLVLLHKKEPVTSIPADALGLFEWAHQLLEDYQLENQDQTTCTSEEAPPSKISYIEVPEEKRQSLYHQYAIPHVHRQKATNGHSKQPSTLSRHSDTGYYSSTPVPIEYHSNTLPATRSSFHPEPKTSKTNKKETRKTKSATNIHHNLQGSDLSMGYFTNGRYYEPAPQHEIYAPASSYSDRSNHLLSTFLAPTIPRTQSFSSSLGNSDGLRESSDREDRDVEGEGDSSDNEALPFDPKDATEPMEV